jgi:GYF domain 2
MVRVRPPVWHLRRGLKVYGRVSDRELRLLVEYGHLKANDLLWRSGFGGWKSAASVPGVLTPAPLAPAQSSTAQSLTAKIGALFSHHWGILVGFLMAAVLGGSIDVAMRASATGTETSEKAVSLQAQGLQTTAASPDAAKAVQSSPIAANGPKTVQALSEPKAESDPTQEGSVFSVSNIHPTDGFTSKPSPIEKAANAAATDGFTSKPSPASLPSSEDSAVASVTNPTSMAQVDSAAKPVETDAASAQPDQSDAMSLPTRKPERSMAEETPRSKAMLKRIARRRSEQEPKPLPFGNIGYNYNPQ